MILIQRTVPLISSVLLAVMFAIWINNSDIIYFIATMFFLINAISIWVLVDFKFLRKNYLNFFSTPFLYLVSSFIFFLVIDLPILQIIYIIGISLVYMLILKNIFTYLHQPKDYQPYALENIYSYVNMITLFLFYSGFYGLILFLGWPLWIFVIVVFAFSSFLFLRTLWSYKIDWQKSKFYVLVVGLIQTEMFYLVSFLPTSYVFNGLVVIIVYYLLMNFLKDLLLEKLSSKSMKQYILISTTILLISILTTRWY